MVPEWGSSSKHHENVFVLFIQYEAKMKTLETNMKEMESKKRILEEAVDSLNEEIAKLKAKGNAGHYLFESCLNSCLKIPPSFDRLNSTQYRNFNVTLLRASVINR